MTSCRLEKSCRATSWIATPVPRLRPTTCRRVCGKASAQVIGELARVLNGRHLGGVALRIRHAPVVERREPEARRQPLQRLRRGADVFAAAGEIDEQVLHRSSPSGW